ncbi:MAG: hypothetical protein II821_03560 [Treponema sp.]|nr:hypothetical protein [Treponema sp.]
MINTYNESDLHSTLKKLYALETNGQMEVKLDDTQWICDIVSEDGNVIEIQTSNLSALTEKTQYILETGRKIKIVHPVTETKWIELYGTNGELLHRKKSPKKASFYDSLRGMTQIAPLFLNKNCTLEVLYCEITEQRRKTESPAQNATKSRRRLKDWLPMGKKLEKILRRERFKTREDWKKLVPEKFRQKDENGNLPAFRKIDFYNEMEKEKGAKTAGWSPLLIWILEKMQLLKVSEVKGRSRFYTVHP